MKKTRGNRKKKEERMIESGDMYLNRGDIELKILVKRLKRTRDHTYIYV